LRLLRRQAPRARPLFGGACRRATIAITIAASAWSVPALAPAAGFRIFHSTALLEHPVGARTVEEFTLGPCCSHDLAADPPLWEVAHFEFPTIGAAPTAAAAPSPTVRFDLTQQPKRFAIGALSGVAILGSFLNAYTDGNRYDFHFTQEGYFGRHTYVGGADKASHFVSYYGVARLMTGVYEAFDLPGESSYRLASATSILAGLATELGDGMNKYGFSYEDFVIDTAGAASAWALAHHRLDDMIGFRFGVVPAPESPEELEVNGTGKDYTREIYTADFKLAGLARRLDQRFGPARFLLVSLTYGVKGYPYAPPELRERQVGLEVGLNVAELARAVGVPENRWWGRIALIILDIVRIPYTAIGVRYDINHRKWIGPDTGQTFSYP